MDFKTVQREFKWHRYEEQNDNCVTYMFVAGTSIPRLIGASDILYVGQTTQTIKKRFNQETRSINSSGNTQNTNIRMTHILSHRNIIDYTCVYTAGLMMDLDCLLQENFLEKLKIWDKKSFLKYVDAYFSRVLTIPIEKYILVEYAHEHLELPPLNNRF